MKNTSRDEPRIPPRTLFVSSALALWTTDTPEMFARDFQLNDICYRQLDPEYFAWLRMKMLSVKQAAAAGDIPAPMFNDLRLRFNTIQKWAIDEFGEAALLDAIRNADLRGYEPPRAESWEWRPWGAPVGYKRAQTPEDKATLARARCLVDEIREKALSLGWKEESLYAAEGYAARRFLRRAGLVCYVGPEKRIGAVTRQSIELIGPPPDEVRTHFFNPDVEQPWIRCVAPAGEKT